MKLASYEHYGASPLKMAGLAAVGATVTGAALAAVAGTVLGDASGPAAFVVGSLVFYIVMTTPRRMLDRERVSQARESPVLGAEAEALVGVTGSRAKALLMLRPRGSSLHRAVSEGARMVLLGSSAERATAEASRGLASYSAAEVLKGIAGLEPGDFAKGDEEARGLAASSELYRETKLPMLMTACFFSPIMLILYAVFTASYDPVRLGGLVAFQFILLDIALFFSSVDGGPR